MRRSFGAAGVVLGLVLAMTPASATRDNIPMEEVWRTASQAGTSMEVVLGGKSFRLRIGPDRDLLAPVTSITGLDDEVPEEVLMIEGWIEGSRGWVRGALLDGRVYVQMATPDLGMVSIMPGTDGSLTAVRSSDVLRLLRQEGIDTRIEPDPETMADDCDSIGWEPAFAHPNTLSEQDPLRDFTVALAVDSSFVALHPDDWHAVALSYMAAIDQLFVDAFDVTIQIVQAVAIGDDDIPGTTTSAVLDTLQDHYVATYPSLERDNVHLFTGRDMTNAGGQVNCVGSAGRTSVSYSVAEGNPGGDYNWFGLSVLPDGAIKIGAHELAHTLSAHHHYANCGESMVTFDVFVPFDACTIMINDWGLIQPVFSSVSRLAVRGWADYYDI